MPNKLIPVKLNQIRSFKSLVAELETLDKLLPAQLSQFAVFNKAYLIITAAIQNAAGNGYFKDPEFIEKFTVSFSHYYFLALNGTLIHESTLPTAWQLMNKASQRSTTPRFILLLMGANAHINHDLPLTLNKLLGKKRGSASLKDVLKIDKLLMKSGKQILGEFDEPNKLIDFIKRRLMFLYYRPIMWLILYWRIKAWRNYQKIKKSGINGSRYETTSVRTATRLLRLTTLLPG